MVTGLSESTLVPNVSTTALATRATESPGSDYESVNLFGIVTGLQKSDEETSSEYGPDDAAAAMDQQCWR